MYWKNDKKISEIQALDKAYTGTITLGATTPSYDLETEIDQNFPIDHITKNQINSVKKNLKEKFINTLLFSLLSKEKASGYMSMPEVEKKIKIEARKVTLHEFDFTQINLPQLNFHVRCSKGTYIRSLAHDFGKSLQSGGYLSHLRRTAIGSYRLDDAFTPDQILKQLEVL